MGEIRSARLAVGKLLADLDLPATADGPVTNRRVRQARRGAAARWANKVARRGVIETFPDPPAELTSKIYFEDWLTSVELATLDESTLHIKAQMRQIRALAAWADDVGLPYSTDRLAILPRLKWRPPN